MINKYKMVVFHPYEHGDPDVRVVKANTALEAVKQILPMDLGPNAYLLDDNVYRVLTLESAEGAHVAILQDVEKAEVDLLHKELFRNLKVEEGFRSRVYLDTANNWTIGYGTNLSSRKLTDDEFHHLFPNVELQYNNENYIVKHLTNFPITEEQARGLLEHDIERCEDEAVEIYNNFYKKVFPTDVKMVILDMLYNLGKTRYMLFTKHVRAMKEQDYNRAAGEIRNSRAYKQAPNRYEALAQILDQAWKDRLNELTNQTESETIKRK